MGAVEFLVDFLVDTSIYVVLSLVFLIMMRKTGAVDYIEKLNDKIPKNVIEDKFFMYILTVFVASTVKLGLDYFNVTIFIEYITVAFLIAFGFLLYQIGEDEKEVEETVE